MTDEKTKLSFRETMGLWAYGYKLASKMTPGIIPLTLARSLVIALQPMIVLFFSARILDQLDGARDMRTIITYVSLTVGITLILSVLKALFTREHETIYAWWVLYQKMLMIEAEQFAKIDFAHAEDSKTSEVLARMDMLAMSGGTGLLNIYFQLVQVGESIFSLIFSVLLLSSVFSAGFRLSGWPAWLLLGIFALGLLLNLQFEKYARLRLERINEEGAAANTAANYYGAYYIRAENAAKDIRLYDQSEALAAIMEDTANKKGWLSFFFFRGRLNGFVIGMLAVVSGGFYLLAGYGALDGTVTVGGIVQSVGAMTALAASVGLLVSQFGQMFSNATFLKPMREYMSLPDLLVKGTKPVPSTKGHEHQIEFRGVSFRYPSTEDYALRDLNLKLTPGERLAVVGLNGSGKTTMIKLLCRLYDPTEGEILLDGVNIKEYDYTQYIDLFSVVFQDYMLFPFELGQNVAANAAYDSDKVNASLDGAGFANRRDTMPNGLDTILYKTFDEDGTQISGGEAQKIALARALYKNAPIVVLDEPTAALDPIAEYEVYTTFDKTIGLKTAVFISHRLSSCRFCHDIAVFDGGRLIQRGDHDTLLADTSGRYHELWEAQASHYREGAGEEGTGVSNLATDNGN